MIKSNTFSIISKLFIAFIIVMSVSCKEEDVVVADNPIDTAAFVLIDSTTFSHKEYLNPFFKLEKLFIKNMTVPKSLTYNGQKLNYSLSEYSLKTSTEDFSNLLRVSVVTDGQVVITNTRSGAYSSLPFNKSFTLSMLFLLESEEGQQFEKKITYDFKTPEKLPYHDESNLSYISFARGPSEGLNPLSQPYFNTDFGVQKNFNYNNAFEYRYTWEFISIKKDDVTIDKSELKLSYDEEKKRVYILHSENLLLDPGKYQIELTLKAEEKHGEQAAWEMIKEGNNTVNFVINNEFPDYKPLNQFPTNNSVENARNTLLSYNFESYPLSSSIFKRAQLQASEIVISNAGSELNFKTINKDNTLFINPNQDFEPNSTTEVVIKTSLRLFNDTTELEVAPYQTFSYTFGIGETYDFPISNISILASYPVARQRYFLIDEYDKGIISLNFTTEELQGLLSSQKEYTLFIKNDLESYNALVSYSAEELAFTFNMPAGLQTETVYSFELYSESDQTFLYKDYFKTSKFRNFNDKLNDVISRNLGWGYNTGEGYQYGTSIVFGENFDQAEQRDLVIVSNTLNENLWYQEFAGPILYDNYAALPFQIESRSLDVYGMPPVNALSISSSSYQELEDSEIGGDFTETYGATVAFVSKVDIVAKSDYSELQQKAINYGGGTNELVDLLINNDYRRLDKDVPITINYTIPGYNEITTTKALVIDYPFD